MILSFMPFIRIQRLHLFTDGTDTYAAFDEQDAIKAWQEWTGEDRDNDYDEFEQIPDWKIIRIGIEADNFDDEKKRRPLFSRIDRLSPNWPSISAPAWVWALHNGRGFLCSTEY